MTHQTNFAFGLPSVPRQSMPSMYQILTWDDRKLEKPKEVSPPKVVQTQEKYNGPEKTVKVEQRVVQNISEVKSQYANHPENKKSKSCTKHYQLYEYKQARGKAQSQSHLSQTKSKVQAKQVVRPAPKILDPNNPTDRLEIEARKKRIKTFQLVTRQLPNTAFTTYYGKPAFEAYGRGGSNPNLLSHNVMPHKGDNHPKSIQSYYSALIKGKRIASTSNVSHVPRKPIEQKREQPPKNEEEVVVNFPLQKPDLINNIRFSSVDPREKKDTHIPVNKITTLKQKNSSKKNKKEKKSKIASKQKQKQLDDGLKYMNTRQNLLQIIQNKKLNASKLAYKVTECYPCQWQNEQKLKQSTKLWQKTKAAGVASKKCQKVSQIFRNTTQKP